MYIVLVVENLLHPQRFLSQTLSAGVYIFETSLPLAEGLIWYNYLNQGRHCKNLL